MSINEIEETNLNKGLGLFIKVFRPYIISLLTNGTDGNWINEFTRTLSQKQKENWNYELENGDNPESLIDFHHLNGFARGNKKLLELDFGKKVHDLPTWLSEIANVRHKIAHYKDSIEEDEAIKAWIHLRTIAKLIGDIELERKLLELQKCKMPQILERTKRSKSTINQHSTETLDIVNCSGLWQEVFAEEVYICPAEGGSFSHRQCRYFGAYFQKRVGAIGEIEAVVDVHSEDDAEIYWSNANQIQEYINRAKQKAIELRPNEFPIRVFLLKDLYSAEFIKDSKGGMQASKMYLDIQNLNVSNVKELIEKLNGKNWSEFGL